MHFCIYVSSVSVTCDWFATGAFASLDALLLNAAHVLLAKPMPAELN